MFVFATLSDREFLFSLNSIEKQCSGFAAFSIQPFIAHGHCGHYTSVLDMVTLTYIVLHTCKDVLFCRDRPTTSVCLKLFSLFSEFVFFWA